MKTIIAIAAIAALSAVTLAAQADTGYDTYRRSVLGDSSVAAAPAVATRTVRVPGSYAQYLINNGSADKSQALVAAAHLGETPVLAQVAVQPKQPRLTPAQAYAKSIGNDVRGEAAVTSAE